MTSTVSREWSHQIDTLRRDKLFRKPPTDKTAYPLLADAVKPHIESFNAIFAKGGLIEEALKEIGTQIVYDGNPDDVTSQRNTLSVRIANVNLEKPQIPPHSAIENTRLDILPSECRERHSTYRGRLWAIVEYKVNNGDWYKARRELGNMPVMVGVCQAFSGQTSLLLITCLHSRTAATSRR